MAKMNHQNVKIEYIGKDIRKNLGITIRQVEEATHIAISTLSKWENNKAIPSLDALVLIGKYFNIPWYELVDITIID